MMLPPASAMMAVTRARLPGLSGTTTRSLTSRSVRTKPRTPMEEKLSRIWQEVLEIGDIGVDDNLYALGADSLSIFRIAARMLDAGLPIEAKHLMRHPTISDLANYAEEQENGPMNGAKQHIPSLKDFRGGARRRLERLT